MTRRAENTVNTRVAITHRFVQRFDRPVRLSTHWLRLRPAPQTRARISAYSLRVHTEPHFLNWVRDPFENYLARLDLHDPVPDLDIELELIAELEPVNPFDFLTEPDAASHPFEYPDQLRKELVPYLARHEPGPRFSRFLNAIDRAPMSTVERLTTLTHRVHKVLTPRTPDTVELHAPQHVDPEALLASEQGTPSQLAWLLTHSLRHLGIAARFASGHRIVLTDDAAHDHVSLHTWTEAFIPGAGWIGLDPSSGLFTAETYIPFACAPELLRVRPIVGYREACEETQHETLRVRRLTPASASWPLTETQWADIHALGRHVQRDLAQQGVSSAVGLTLSFVSTTYGGAPEWHGNALGPSKRTTAEALLEGLRQRVGRGGVPQLGQGEWYSGEPLPRWRLDLYFRADGEPLWRNAERLAWGKPQQTLRASDAYAFSQAVARALGVPTERVLAAHEDPLHQLWLARSAALPGTNEIADASRRKQLAERLSQPEGEPSGYVLPLTWDHAAGRFRSSAWVFRRSNLFLMPGDSPVGYRLPLGSLHVDEETAIEAQLERSAFDAHGALPDVYPEVKERLEAGHLAQPRRSHAPPPAQPVTRTALCVQVRDGRLHVFLPPVTHLEHYVELITAVEAAAETTQAAVILEGYAPPHDPRLHRVALEPDAGVLRVSLPELQAWRAQVDTLEATYDEALRVGLCAERKLLDGTTIPPGGGARWTLAGTSPNDSPFLERPEILRSLIAYWQRHPSLSYFFAGRMVGASGPAPRVDEGRDDALYELEVALSRLTREHSAGPWHADRVLRHLLSDLAGDQKRAELRVDQLYAPDSERARLGRIAIGSFETAPHARLAALQALLMSALLGHFARTSAHERGRLERWGTALHDRFMLPAVLWQDLGRVLDDLATSGYPFQLEWFESLMKLRFPVFGRMQFGNIAIELQHAHEPWPLLAEEMTLDGMTRFIDAANERLQTRLTGLTPGRYVLVCNGHHVPLQPTPVQGEFVAGVRYKIANPPATLHPTLPPVQSLVFDLVDLWTGRIVGGCTYLPPQPQLWGPIGAPLAVDPRHVGEPAESPRAPALPQLSLAPLSGSGRLLPYGSGLETLTPPPQYHDPEYPYLLDLTQRT